MKCMKVIAVIAAVALESALASESNAISDVRSALAAAVNGLQPKRSGVCKYMQEVGFRNRGSAEYESLAIVVSNHFETVVSNFCICATNDLERMVLMSAGWFCDDDYYDVALRYLERSFYYDKQGISEELWNKLKIKIEAFLGCPLRPIEQVGLGM